MLQLNVPFIKGSEIEHAATETLRRYAKATGTLPRPPIPIDGIIESLFGLTLEVEDLKARLGVGDVLGATWFDEQIVRVDTSLEAEGKEGRFAFTLAHEGGHWTLHRPLWEAEKVTRPLFAGAPGKDPPPAIVCRASQAKARAEVQADQYAAALLMPASDVRATMRALYGDDPPSWPGLRRMHKAGQFDAHLHEVAAAVIGDGKFSNVSNQAMRFRLVDLKLVMDSAEVQPRLL